MKVKIQNVAVVLLSYLEAKYIEIRAAMISPVAIIGKSRNRFPVKSFAAKVSPTHVTDDMNLQQKQVIEALKYTSFLPFNV